MNNEIVLASECGNVECPSELPDWGSGTGGSEDSGGSGDNNNNNGGGDNSGESPEAGTDPSTGQFNLNTTSHGKYNNGS